MKRAVLTTLTAAFVLAPTIALAHTGQGDTGRLVHGFIHPLTGSDHVLVMVAVGLLSAQLGGRALWLVPLSFVSVMAIAGAFGMAGIRVPLPEAGIALSIIVLGLALAIRVKCRPSQRWHSSPSLRCFTAMSTEPRCPPKHPGFATSRASWARRYCYRESASSSDC